MCVVSNLISVSYMPIKLNMRVYSQYTYDRYLDAQVDILFFDLVKHHVYIIIQCMIWMSDT